MTTFLLDTHIWLWLQTAPKRVGDDLLDRLGDESNEILLSAASSWEISMMYGLGKLDLPQPPEAYVPDRLRQSGTGSLAVEHLHTLRVAALPSLHRDPFDRLLIAQTQLLDLVLVTADPQIAKYDVTIEFVES
jgi:PIN domain nuclease of toxin-antitoxin system